jgi:ribosome-associated protein
MRIPVTEQTVERPDDEDLAILCARLADENRARDIIIMDMRQSMPLCDFFVIATGTSHRQMQTVVDAVKERIKQFGMRPLGVEGYREGRWILLDLGSIVVHVFDDEARDYYDLELLWGDAHRVDWAPARPGPDD